jgi:5-methylcytosine-specific restriction endonuclease McrA
MTAAEAKRQWRQDIKEHFQHRCVYCGSTEQLTIDHIKPKTSGGRDEARNLVCACRTCNHAKGSQHWLAWWVGQQSFDLNNFKLVLEHIN